MISAMDSRTRVEAALELGVADRPPAGAWGHTYREEWSPQELARITVERARELGWDFVKFQPRASSFSEAFGAGWQPSGRSNKGPVLTYAPALGPEDWPKLELVNPKALDDQVEAIGMVATELGPRVPVIQTVFSPITVAGYLAGKDEASARRALRDHADAVVPALQKITAALIDFSVRSVEAGAAGVFYAISGYATKKAMPEAVYREVVLPFDRQVLSALPDAAWFNVLHLCGSGIYTDLAAELPIGVLSFSTHNQGNPTLAEARDRTHRAVMGGLDQRRGGTLMRGSPDDIVQQAKEAIEQTQQGRGLLLAPGCSVPPMARSANLKAIMGAVAA
jgi:uroporphyrinogen decarboxylase